MANDEHRVAQRIRWMATGDAALSNLGSRGVLSGERRRPLYFVDDDRRRFFPGNRERCSPLAQQPDAAALP